MGDLNVTIDRNGPLSDSKPVSDQILHEYREKVPALLLELWQTQGVGHWLNGLFSVCIPSDFKELLSQIFHADNEFSHSDCHAFGYSAFGTVFAWSERYGLIEIHLPRNEVIANGLTKGPAGGALENALTVLLFRLTKDNSLDAYDDDDKKLFARAVKKLGRPDIGQAFGFVPALALGGAPNLENIKIVSALEHFLVLAQLQQFKLVDYLSRPPSIVREIG